ncbi:MAG: hypothetical protein FJZ92_04875 [Chloroflexi bacterium]|nr:hypothetical protein [Chloroflexota bacterium]
MDAGGPFALGAMHVPNFVSGRKLPFLDALRAVVARWRGGPALLAGDTNTGRIGVDEEAPGRAARAGCSPTTRRSCSTSTAPRPCTLPPGDTMRSFPRRGVTMAVDELLLRHLYKYDRMLPLLPTSEPEEVVDPRTAAAVPGLRRERVTFGSTHDERVLATLTYPASGGPFAAVIMQHGSTPMGRHSWQTWPSGPLHQSWAESGLMTVAVDAYGFGSRESPDNRGRLHSSRPDLLFRTRDQRVQAIQDLVRTVDYLQTRDDVRAGAVGYVGVSMGCRIGVPFFALDRRVAAGAFFVGGSAPYSRFEVRGTEFADLDADEELVFALTDPMVFAPLTAGRPAFMANGTRDVLVTKEGGERLQAALGEPKTLRWFDGGHGETPRELYEESRRFLVEHLRGARAPVAAS